MLLVDDDVLLLDDEVGSVFVVEVSEELGAGSTWIGGRSLTCASAALTICQVNVVANTATRTQAPAMAHFLIPTFSQDSGDSSSTRHQGFLKPRGQIPADR